jgi:hypothetical protein
METVNKVGLKLVKKDLGSITEVHGRVIYTKDEWIDVPGNGAYVAITGGLLAAGDGDKCIYLECDGIVRDAGVTGVMCFSRVRHVDPRPEKVDPYLSKISHIWDEAPDKALLADLAKTDPDCDVRAAAVSRVEDKALLADLAKTDPDCDVRATASRRLARIKG